MEFMLDTNICIYLRLSLTLVTNNLREFHRIPGLRVENWV
jgi:predicted nucleic acid-binding protein